MENDIRLMIAGELDPSSSCLLLCRICQEEENEKSASMESPCSCSGTLKFAHRRCIQRWCDEKGSSVCEICLQKLEPGYTVPSKSGLLDIAVTIRRNESQNIGGLIQEDESDLRYPRCSSPSDTTRSATCLKSTVLILTLVLLTKHLIIVVSAGEGHHPFALTAVLLSRAVGILLPSYFMTRTTTAIQNGQRNHRTQLHERDASQMHGVDEDQQAHHTIQIHS